MSVSDDELRCSLTDPHSGTFDIIMAFSGTYVIFTEVIDCVQLFIRRLYTDDLSPGVDRFTEIERQFYTSCCNPRMLDHTPIVLFRRDGRGEAHARQYSHGPYRNMPWGVPLPPCKGCGSDVNVDIKFELDKMGKVRSVLLSCWHCALHAKYAKPAFSHSWLDPLDNHLYDGFWQTPFPCPQTSVEWFKWPRPDQSKAVPVGTVPTPEQLARGLAALNASRSISDDDAR